VDLKRILADMSDRLIVITYLVLETEAVQRRLLATHASGSKTHDGGSPGDLDKRHRPFVVGSGLSRKEFIASAELSALLPPHSGVPYLQE